MLGKISRGSRSLVLSALLIAACGTGLNDEGTSEPVGDIPGPQGGASSVAPVVAQGGASRASADVNKDVGGAPSDAGDTGGSSADSKRANESTGKSPGVGGETDDSEEEADDSEVLELPPNWTPAALQPPPHAWYFATDSDYVVAPPHAPDKTYWLEHQQTGRDLWQVSQWAPQLVTSSWNAPHKTFHFNRASILRLDGWAVPPIGTNAGFTILAVLRSEEPQNAGIAGWWSEWGDGVWANLRNTSGLTLLDHHRLNDGTLTEMFAGNQDLGTGGHIVAWRYVPETRVVTLMIDGVLAASTPQPLVGDITPMTLYVGAMSPLPTGLFLGDISELVFVPDDISDENLQYYTEYAANTWFNGIVPSSGQGPCIKYDLSHSPESIRCDDGNPNTFGDHCSAGTCVGTVPGPGSPKELSPVAWYHAGAPEIVVTWDGISTWYDRSPERRDLLNGYWGRPTLVPNGWNDVDPQCASEPNCKPSVHFSGSNALKRNGWTGTPAGLESAFTVLAVLKPTPGLQSSGVVSWFHPGAYGQIAAKIGPSGASALNLYRLDGILQTQDVTGTNAVGTGTRHAVAWRYENGTVKFTVDGFAQAQTHSPLTGIPTDWFLMGAASGYPTGLFTGDIAELAVIPRSITDTEVGRFNDYAQGHWGGLTLCLPDCAGKPNGADNECGGTCAEPGGAGDPCTQTSQCHQDLICTNGTCGCQQGALCSAQCPCGPGGFCSSQTQCKEGLECTDGICACPGGLCTCQSNLGCPAGSFCGFGAGPRFGLGSDANVCMPLECAQFDAYLPDCGIDNPACGSCVEQLDCNGRECSADGACGSCGVSQVCSMIGQCVPVRRSDRATLPVPLPPPLPQESTSAVGALEATFNVTDRGNARYVIPLELPPGRLDLVPQIALEYLSTNRDGYLGVGWRLDGLSAISRCPRIRDLEGAAEPVRYSADDSFCMDGKRLVRLPNSTTEYRTEIDTFRKISAVGEERDASGMVVGPSHFKVFEPDGRILMYGFSPRASVSFGATPFGAGGIKRVWALETIEDRTGNAIRIDYKSRLPEVLPGRPEARLRHTTELLPLFIGYTKRGVNSTAISGSYDSWISFSYEERPDTAEQYTAGAVGHSVERMKSIEVVGGGAPVRRYHLEYEEPLGESRLESVRECAVLADDEEVCKTATSFDYFEEMGFEPEREVLLPVAFGVERIVAVLDFNGDGRDDLLVQWASQDGYQVLLGDVESGSIRFTTSTTLAPSEATGNCFSGTGGPRVVTHDVDRDGRDDLICDGWMLLSRPDDFFAVEFSSMRLPSMAPLLGDLNGDGLKDVIRCHADIVAVQYGGRGYFSDEVWNGEGPPVYCPNLMVIDADGDGLEDLLHIPDGSVRRLGEVSPGQLGNDAVFNTTPLFHLMQPPKVIDFNGDGLKDVLANVGAQLVVLINTGKGFEQRILANGYSNAGFFAPISPAATPIPGFSLPPNVFIPDLTRAMVVDFDGDGRQDLLANGAAFAGNPAATFLFRSDTHSFQIASISSDPAAPSDPRLGGSLRMVAPVPHSTLPKIGDFDGDGQGDVITAATEVSLTLNRHRGRRNWLLNTIRDGLGQTTSISYDLTSGHDISDTSITTYDAGDCETEVERLPGESLPLPGDLPQFACVRTPPPLVSEHRIFEEGRPGLRFIHSYRTLRHGLRGRGPFGFEQRIARKIDDASRIATTTWVRFHNHRFDVAGMPKTVETHAGVSASAIAPLHSNGTYRILTWEQQTSASGRPFWVLRDEADQQLVNSQVVYQTNRTAEAVDDWGNTTSAVVATTLGGEVAEINVTTTPFTVDEEEWLLRSSDSMEIANVRRVNGQLEVEVRKATFGYYDNGLLRETVREPNDPDLQLTTTLTRDEWGNVTTFRNEDAAGNVREESVGYAGMKVTPTSVTDAKGFKTELEFSAAFGDLLTARDANGLVEQRSHDGFGRLKRVVTPTAERTIAYLPGRRIDDAPFGGFDTAWHVVDSTTGEGSVEFDFDAFNRTLRLSSDGFDGQTVAQEYEYDWAGRLIRLEQPHGGYPFTQGRFTYEYDNLDRLKRVRHPDSSIEEYHYALPGATTVAAAIDSRAFEVIAMVGRKGAVTLSSLDHEGEPLRVVEVGAIADLQNPPSGTTYTYGPFGELKQVVDVRGATTTITPDRLGRTRVQDDPAAGHHEYTYTAFDEVKTHIDGNNQVFSYEYDELSRLRFVRSAVDTIAEFRYDEGSTARGHLTSTWRQARPAMFTNGVLEPGSTEGNWVRYEYEAPSPAANRGRLMRIVHELTGEPAPFVMAFGYDPEIPSRLQTIEYPTPEGEDPFVTLHEYDEAGNVMAVRGPDGEALWQLTESDQGLYPSREIFGNGVVTRRDYFAFPFGAPSSIPECNSSTDDSCMPGRIHGINVEAPDGRVFRNSQYHFDRNGNTRQRLIRESSGALITDIFTHDAFDQLKRHETQSAAAVPVVEYNYDDAGNFDTVSESTGGSDVYGYDPVRPYRVTSVTRGGEQTQYIYDGNGNQTIRSGSKVSAGHQTIDYNELGLPWRVTTGQGENASEDTIEYDGDGVRVARRTPTGTTYSMGEGYQRTEANNSPGRFEHRYRVHALGREVANVVRIQQQGATTTESKQYLHDDALGSVVLVTDEEGEILEERARLDAYGASSSSLPGTSGSEAGFTGHQHEDGLGLIDMGGRFYDPKLRRFVSPDPFVTRPYEKLGLNRYAYVHNNPVTSVDPSGFMIQTPDGQIRPIRPTPPPPKPPKKPAKPKSGGEANPGGGAGADPGKGTATAATPDTSDVKGRGKGEAEARAAGGANCEPNCSGGPPPGTTPKAAEPAVRPDEPTGPPQSHSAASKPVGGHALLDAATRQIPNTHPTWKAIGEGMGKAAEIAIEISPIGRAAAGVKLVKQAPKALSGARALVNKAKDLRKCFPAGTEVSTPDGDRPIESLQEGDEVYAFDFETGEVVVREIKTIFQREAIQLVQLTVDGDLIEATMEHPFWVSGRGWVEAGHLEVGMELWGIDGEARTITSIGGRSGPVAVFNFEVDEEHTYFVGDEPVLVHNTDPINTDFNKAVNEALKWLRSQGIDTSKVEGPNDARFGPDKGKPNGVRFAGGGYYRIEYDARSGAHINVGAGKTKGPHIKFEGTQKTVNKLIRRLFRC